jgi:hypothetical protein
VERLIASSDLSEQPRRDLRRALSFCNQSDTDRKSSGFNDGKTEGTALPDG